MPDVQKSLLKRTWIRYAIAIVAVAAGFGLRRALTLHVGESLPTYITFYPAVVVAALLAGLGPGFLATALTVVVVACWVSTSQGFITHSNPAEVVGAVLFSLMGVFLTVLTEFYRRAKERAAALERQHALRDTEQALQSERDFVSAVLDTAGALVVVLDNEGRILRFNHACEQGTGYQSAEVIGKVFWDFLLLPEDVAPVKTVFARLRTGDFPSFHENHWVGKEGERRLIAWSNTCIPGPAGQVRFVVATGIDVTEQRKANAALRMSEERLRHARTLLEAVTTGTEVIISTVDADLRYTFFNEAYQQEIKRLTGREIHLGLNIEELFAHMPEQQKIAVEQWRRVLRGESVSHRIEFGDPRQHRRIYSVRLSPLRNGEGALVGAGEVAIDVTDQVLTEEGLRESESFYRQTLESIPGMVFTTRPDGFCDFQSQQWVDFTGVPMSEHLGSGWSTLLHPDDQPRALAAWRDAVEGRAPYDLEYRVRRRDGAYEWFKVRAHPIRNVAGQVVRWFGTALNIDDLVNTKTALERSERLYRAIGESINYGIWISEPDGRNTYTSECFLKLVGMTQEQCSNYGWGDVLHPDDAQQTVASWKECVRSCGIWDIEHRFRGVDGQFHAILARGVPVKDERGEIVCWAGINLDISRLKQTEQALRESREDLNHAQAVAHIGSWRLNLQRNALFWSDETYRIFGISKDTALTYEVFLDAIHPEDRDFVDQKWKAALCGESYDMEHRIVVGGTVKWIREQAVLEFDQKGGVIGGFGTAQDITEWKRVESALAQARTDLERTVEQRTARLRQIVEKLRSSVIVHRKAEQQIKEAEFQYRTVADFTYDWEYWLTPEGALRYCSPSCERITGYTAGEFVADPKLLSALIHPEDHAIWEQHEHDALATPEQRSIQFRILSKDGGIRWIEHACQPVIGDAGVFLGVRAGNRDLTQRKEAELETQRLRTELARVSRLTTAGHMAAALAHELNQPLGAIVCNVQAAEHLLRQNPIDLGEVLETLVDIEADGKRAGEVIHRLRALYQKTGQKRTDLQLNEVIEETVRLLNSEFLLRGASAELDLDPQLPAVYGNAIELQQVVINLVVNALDAMTARESQNRTLHITTRCPAGRAVEVAFRDTGTGLSAESLKRVGEPFFTTKPTGMGMGLAISLSITEAHGGRLWAENNSDHGATFYLSIPAFSGQLI